MAKIDMTRFKQSVESAIREIKRPAQMKQYGAMIADLIRVRTRLGYGVSAASGPREKLKTLADSTIKSRGGKIGTTKKGKRTVKKNKKSTVVLSEFTTPGKSNLTRSGQLLESLKPTAVGEGYVVVGPDGSRKGEKVSNAEVAYFVTKGGRPFLNLTKPEVRQMSEKVRRDLSKILERVLKK